MGRLTPLLLIAGREFNAYVATLSFWIAVFVGPLAMAGALAVTSLAARPAPPVPVAIHADEPGLAAAAAAALRRASVLEDRPEIRVASAPAAANLTVRRAADGAVEVSVQGPVPLSATGRELLATRVERDDALRQLGRPAPPERAPAVQPGPATPLGGPMAAATPSRFVLVMMLWLTLTGSLGMLLQAVVRERANRALESLLAAARPWQIVFGKLAGVGGVSLLVVGAWLGACAGLAGLAPNGGGLVTALLREVSQPGLLVQAVAVYLLAYLFFGLITVAIGAAAADVAAAQNLSRPMFAVLLAVFFTALAGAGGAGGLAWLVYVPPFTPFLLLLKAHSAGEQALALGLLAMAIAAAGWIAVNGLSLNPGAGRALFSRRRARRGGSSVLTG